MKKKKKLCQNIIPILIPIPVPNIVRTFPYRTAVPHHTRPSISYHTRTSNKPKPRKNRFPRARRAERWLSRLSPPLSHPPAPAYLSFGVYPPTRYTVLATSPPPYPTLPNPTLPPSPARDKNPTILMNQHTERTQRGSTAVPSFFLVSIGDHHQNHRIYLGTLLKNENISPGSRYVRLFSGEKEENLHLSFFLLCWPVCTVGVHNTTTDSMSHGYTTTIKWTCLYYTKTCATP